MIDNEYINLSFKHQTTILAENESRPTRTNTDIEAKLCSKNSYIFDVYPEKFAKKRFGTLYCMEPEPGSNFTLQGNN